MSRRSRLVQSWRRGGASAGAGDELQGIKRGLLELADIIAVNKADGDNVERANRAAMEYRTGLHILAAGHAGWEPQVLTLSARDNRGLDELWTKIGERYATLTKSGALGTRRADEPPSTERRGSGECESTNVTSASKLTACQITALPSEKNG